MSPTSSLEPVGLDRATLTQRVQRAIEDAITSRDLRPGTRVTESDLAERLHVSKTPVREALQRLQYMGLIEPDGARGGRIVAPSATRIEHAYELREGLEVQSARLAARRATEAEATEIYRVAVESAQAAARRDIPGVRAADRTFHRCIATAARNDQLAQLIENSFVLTWALRLRDVPMGDDSSPCAQQHVDVADAIRAQDPDAAGTAMSTHLTTVRMIVLNAFERGEHT